MVCSVEVGHLKTWYFYAKKGNHLHQQLFIRNKSVREININIQNCCFNFLFLFKKMEDSFTILERYINEKKSRYNIKKVSANELWVIQCWYYSGHPLSKSQTGPSKKFETAENSKLMPSIKRWLNLILHLLLYWLW